MEPMMNIALRAARAAGNVIVKATDNIDRVGINSKSVNDFVTEVDLAAERTILHHLQKTYPTHSFLCEESGLIEGTGEGKDSLWIIDPLDGTTNFIHGVPHFAVSIAMQYKGKLEHAVIIDPMRQEEFTASRGRGAQLNGKRIRVSTRKSLEGALLCTGFPFRQEQQSYLDAYLEMFKKLSTETAGIRRAGSAALDLAYVAAGRYDGFWELGLQTWDVAAGALLVTEAGGLISDLGGGDNHLKNGNVVCGNPKVFKQTLQVIHPFLSPDMKR
ncbi:MAG: inositol-1-monophosphatase [Gammaproteobacteria bacterium]|nr:inositol-1-monophosphatase [Gammaproteobacteria bacterium]